MTQYYRVTLESGITIDEQKPRFYSKSPELGVTVFKSLREAKRKFNEITNAEISRLQELRKVVRAFKTRNAVPVSDAE